MPGLLSAPLLYAPRRLDVFTPVDLAAPLNRGLLQWHLVVPHQMGGVVWRNLVRPVHATLVGTEPRSATQGWGATPRPGGFGEVRFSGTTSYGSLASSTAYDFANTSFTVSCWLRANSAAQATIVGRRLIAAAEGHWFVRIDATGTATSRLADDNGALVAQRISASAVLVDGAWHHLLVVFTTNSAGNAGNDMLIYIDGRLDVTARTGSGLGYSPPPVRDVTFGTTAGAPNPTFSGALDDVRIATRGLSAREVQDLYQASRLGYQRELRWLRPTRLLLGAAPWVKLPTTSGSVLVAGTPAGGSLTVPVAAGAVTLAGSAVGLSVRLAAAPGVVTLTGQDAAFTSDLSPTMLAESESVTLVGTTAAFGVSLVAPAGAVTLTGTDVALDADLSLAGAAGAVTVVGTDVVLGAGFQAAAGGVTLTGTAATLGSAGETLLTGTAGSLAISGTAALFSITMPADPGSLRTGFQQTMPAALGTLTVAGTDAVLGVVIPPTPLVLFPSVVAQGRERGVSQAVLVAGHAVEDGARIVATDVLQAGTRIAMVVYECTTAFGTTNGLTAVDIGDAAVPDRWGRSIGITAGTKTGYGDAALDALAIDTAGPVWVSAVGGAFDDVGACRLSILWERAHPEEAS